MIRSVKLLTFLQLRNLFGMNEAIYSKNKKKKNRLLLMGFAILLLGAMMCFYIGALTYGFIMFGMAEIIPMYLAAVISLISFVFTVFRAGPALFNMKTYENLAVLPVRPAAIIISRFLTLYLSDMIFSVVATVSVLVVCGFTLTLSPFFYILMIVGAFFLPLLPMTISMIIGTLIFSITSRMRRKNMMQIIFSMTFLALYFIFLQNFNGELDEIVDVLSGAVNSLKRIYPPSVWFSKGVEGELLYYGLFLIVSLAAFLIFALLIGRFFQAISTGLFSQAAKRNYVMKEQKNTSPLKACLFRERKRYFSSSVYVMNTLVGYIMMIVVSVMLVFGDMSAVLTVIPASFIVKLAPFVMAMLMNLSPTTVSAFSMEGKHFWLTQSLPVDAKTVVHAKLLMNLVFAIPSALISSAVLLFALRPTGPDILWLLLLPLVFALFGTVTGLFINIKMPMLNWTSESMPVKQSKAVLVMMLISFASAAIPLTIFFFIPSSFEHIYMLAVTVLFIILTSLLYRKLRAVRMNDLIER